MKFLAQFLAQEGMGNKKGFSENSETFTGIDIPCCSETES